MTRAAVRLVCLVALFPSAGCDGLFGPSEPPAPPPVVAPAPAPVPVPPTPVAQPQPAPTPAGSDKGTLVAAAPDKPAAPATPPPERSAQRTRRGRCENTCQYANDGECDDGRPNAHTSLCGAGTDCADCGPVGRRFRRSGPAAGACNNTCQHANDGECDDGRPNAHTSLCAAGSDCADCGPWGRAFRRSGGGGGAVAAGACSNTCQHANDGECDDGRSGSHTDLCAAGTDCADCGAWGRPFRQGGRCTNTCQHANDGECDDGRPGSVTDLCARGTDCADCGPT